MTPKLPPPPFSAHSRSAFSCSVATITSPSAVTTSAEIRLSQAKPSFRSSQPLPLPVVKPATPVDVTRPPVTARPNCCVSRSKVASPVDAALDAPRPLDGIDPHALQGAQVEHESSVAGGEACD